VVSRSGLARWIASDWRPSFRRKIVAKVPLAGVDRAAEFPGIGTMILLGPVLEPWTRDQMIGDRVTSEGSRVVGDNRCEVGSDGVAADAVDRAACSSLS
jgi:hypothetical protein